MADPLRWKPNVTVAVVLEHAGRYLLVEEETPHGRQFNQPAGHLDPDESLLAAAAREAREETWCEVRPTALVGIYQWSPPTDPTLDYLRFAYAADLLTPATPVDTVSTAFAQEFPTLPARPLDQGIVRAVWLSYDEVLACRDRHRSPLVLQCIDDLRAGRRFPLELVRHYPKG
ncbi:NUDIX domain-containing protein [Chitinimonas lacunae]|uniref:NUDIX domain-containing protein n=1 Tax=Chitinimonas lacunae TaxID=1963018 RepID=A0ABV8MRS5_9NEIS